MPDNIDADRALYYEQQDEAEMEAELAALDGLAEAINIAEAAASDTEGLVPTLLRSLSEANQTALYLEREIGQLQNDLHDVVLNQSRHAAPQITADKRLQASIGRVGDHRMTEVTAKSPGEQLLDLDLMIWEMLRWVDEGNFPPALNKALKKWKRKSEARGTDRRID